MSRFVLAGCIIGLMAVGTARAQQGPQPPAPAPWANKFFLPGIEKNPGQAAPPVIVHDFGTMPHGTLGVHKFRITNVYDVPMQVIDIRRSCGCLTAEPPQRVLQPMESAELVVTMDTAKFSGANAQTIYVTFGPQFISTAVLRIQGVSRADVNLSPGRVDFGNVAQGAKAVQNITVDYQGRQRDWKVLGVVPSPSPFDVEVKQVAGGFVGTKYQVAVSLKADAPAGPISDVITLKTSDPTYPLVQINVAGTVLAPLSLSTNLVQFPKLRVGDTPASFKVMVRATEPFRIQSQPDDGDGVSIEAFPAAAPVQIVTVKFNPAKPGVVRKEVRLKTDLKGGAFATLTIQGDAEPGPPPANP